MRFETSLENASQDKCCLREAADCTLSLNINQADPVLTRNGTAAVFLEMLPEENFSYIKSFPAKLKSKTIHVTRPLDWEMSSPCHLLKLYFTEVEGTCWLLNLLTMTHSARNKFVSSTHFLPVSTLCFPNWIRFCFHFFFMLL